MKKNLLLTVYLLFIFIISCAPQRIKLSKAEKKLEEQMQINYNCNDIKFRHDYSAINNNSSDGSFGVILCDSFCSLDSSELKELALEMTPKIIQVLNFKSNYKEIIFYTSIEKNNS